MLIEGALANALAFTGSSYLFHRLSADNIVAERKRHDAVIEALQAAQIEWVHNRQQRINFIDNQLRLERKAETKVTELNDAIREYHEVGYTTNLITFGKIRKLLRSRENLAGRNLRQLNNGYLGKLTGKYIYQLLSKLTDLITR